MTSPSTTPPKLTQTRPRRLQIVLRDGGTIDGGVYLSDGQSLAPYLGTRKGGWVNIVSAVWRDEGETHNHAVIQADHILLAIPGSADLPVSPATTGPSRRPIDISLDDGTRIQGELHLAEKQRLSDYLSGCGKFMPVIGATRAKGDRKSDGPAQQLGDIALNCACVKSVRDAKAPEAAAMSAAEASAAWGGLRRSSAAIPAAEPPAPPPRPSTPVNREIVQNTGGSFEVITPGRVPDRRIGMPAYVSPVPRHAEPGPIDESLLTPAERERAQRAARHWLVKIATDAQLLGPDPRELSDALALDELWQNISKRNEMAEIELAIHVGTSLKLGFADFDDVSPEAIRIVPEKLARKLGILPIKVEDKSLVVAVSDPASHEIEQQLGFVTRLNLRFVIASPGDIREALYACYNSARPAT